APREAEGGEEAHEADRRRGDPPGGVPGGVAGGVGGATVGRSVNTTVGRSAGQTVGMAPDGSGASIETSATGDAPTLRPSDRPTFVPSDRPTVVVIQPAFLGDVVLTTPLLAALASVHGPVDVVTTPAAAILLETHPAVATVIRYDKRGAERGLHGAWRVSRQLRGRGYLRADLPHQS